MHNIFNCIGNYKIIFSLFDVGRSSFNLFFRVFCVFRGLLTAGVAQDDNDKEQDQSGYCFGFPIVIFQDSKEAAGQGDGFYHKVSIKPGSFQHQL
jgi:hypothetical protein